MHALGGQRKSEGAAVAFSHARSPSAKRSAAQRPASAGAGERVRGRRGDKGSSPAALDACSVPAAGKPCIPDEEAHKPLSPDVKNHAGKVGVGWKVKTLAQEEQLRHDPILHRIDVFVRGRNGHVEARAAEWNTREYSEALHRAVEGPKRPARRKGVAEFIDISAPGAAKWDPNHAAALEDNRHAFHRQQGEFSEVYNNAARYPCTPKPFEPGGLHPAGCARGFGAVSPASRAASRVSPRPTSSRVRRPQSAGRISATPAQPVPKLSAER